MVLPILPLNLDRRMQELFTDARPRSVSDKKVRKRKQRRKLARDSRKRNRRRERLGRGRP